MLICFYNCGRYPRALLWLFSMHFRLLKALIGAPPILPFERYEKCRYLDGAIEENFVNIGIKLPAFFWYHLQCLIVTFIHFAQMSKISNINCSSTLMELWSTFAAFEVIKPLNIHFLWTQLCLCQSWLHLFCQTHEEKLSKSLLPTMPYNTQEMNW